MHLKRYLHSVPVLRSAVLWNLHMAIYIYTPHVVGIGLAHSESIILPLFVAQCALLYALLFCVLYVLYNVKHRQRTPSDKPHRSRSAVGPIICTRICGESFPDAAAREYS